MLHEQVLQERCCGFVEFLLAAHHAALFLHILHVLQVLLCAGKVCAGLQLLSPAPAHAETG
jgi:hypothetical protein